MARDRDELSGLWRAFLRARLARTGAGPEAPDVAWSADDSERSGEPVAPWHNALGESTTTGNSGR